MLSLKVWCDFFSHLTGNLGTVLPEYLSKHTTEKVQESKCKNMPICHWASAWTYIVHVHVLMYLYIKIETHY